MIRSTYSRRRIVTTGTSQEMDKSFTIPSIDQQASIQSLRPSIVDVLEDCGDLDGQPALSADQEMGSSW